MTGSVGYGQDTATASSSIVWMMKHVGWIDDLEHGSPPIDRISSMLTSTDGFAKDCAEEQRVEEDDMQEMDGLLYS